ncbi:MAG: hypothetical protein AAB288_13470, partial [Acidobacteriota bacterium]
QGLSSKDVTKLRKSIQKAETSKDDVEKLRKLADSVEKNAASAKNEADGIRLKELSAILRQPTL